MPTPSPVQCKTRLHQCNPKSNTWIPSLNQVALAAPGRRNSGCGCDSSDDSEDHHVSSSDRLLIQRVKGGLGRTTHQKPCVDDSSSEESEECHHKPSKPSKPCSKPQCKTQCSCDRSSEEKDDCTQVSKPQIVRTNGRCEESEKIYLHRQAPIYVRPPPSRIFINHPPVVVRQPPVILHHQSRSPVLVKPILIKEREVAARPVLFKISKPDCQVSVSKCEPPRVHVESCSKPSCSNGCTCPRKEKDC